MKSNIIFLFLFLSICTFAQDSNSNVKYNFKYVYYMFTPRNGGPDKIIPTGRDCLVNYNTFYKKYFIGWTDQKGVTAGSYFYYVPSDIEKENIIMANDDNGGKYVIINAVKEDETIILVDQKFNKDFKIRIIVSNKEL